MIVGTCIHCSEPFMLEVPEQTPVFRRHTCDACQQPMWTKISRVDPVSWTEEAFLREHEIDHATRRITPKSAPVS